MRSMTGGLGVSGPFRHMERSQLLERGIPIGIWLEPEATSNQLASGSGIELRLRLVP